MKKFITLLVVGSASLVLFPFGAEASYHSPTTTVAKSPTTTVKKSPTTTVKKSPTTTVKKSPTTTVKKK